MQVSASTSSTIDLTVSDRRYPSLNSWRMDGSSDRTCVKVWAADSDAHATRARPIRTAPKIVRMGSDARIQGKPRHARLGDCYDSGVGREKADVTALLRAWSEGDRDAG